MSSLLNPCRAELQSRLFSPVGEALPRCWPSAADFPRLSSAGGRPRSRPGAAPHPTDPGPLRTHAEVGRRHAAARRTRTPKINITARSGGRPADSGSGVRRRRLGRVGVIELAAVGSAGEAARAQIDRIRPLICRYANFCMASACACAGASQSEAATEVRRGRGAASGRSGGRGN